MQLLKLEVRNWVHHRYRLCEFTRGLVAILGENGSGKSSLFGAIRWALTGENPNFGVKSDNISQYAKEGEPSYVTLEFEHNGHIAVVSRHLRPEKEQSLLKIDGVEAGRGDKSVTAGIEKLLGVDAKFISRFIIVGQTDIFSFIDDSQSDTDKFFQRLFNTAKADKCQDVIGKKLAKIVIPEIVVTPGQIDAQAVETSAQRATLREQIDTLADLDTILAAQKADQVVLAGWGRRTKIDSELQQIAIQKKQNSDKLAEAAAAVQQYTDDIAALSGATAGKDGDYAAARTALGHWAAYNRTADARTKLEQQRAELEKAQLANPEVSEVTAAVQQSAQALVAELQVKRDNAAQFLKVFDPATGIAACPTCATPTAALKDKIDETEQTLRELDALLVAARNDCEQIRKQREARLKWEKTNADLQAKASYLQQSSANLSAIEPPGKPESELTQVVTDYEEFQKVRAAMEPLLQQANEAQSKLTGTVSSLEERATQLLAELGGITTSAEEAKNAAARQDGLRAEYDKRLKLEEQVAGINFQLQQLAKDRDNAVQQEKDAVKLREFSAVAEQARDALKNAPRLVAQRNLQKLENAINELLQIFGVNFLVKVSEDGSATFIAEFFDGRKQVAQRLSIGQKTVLALAFRVAVNAMFAEEIGLLALDEPTASLDTARIRALAPVLERLRDLSTSKGLQCLLVTHASNLAHLFESSIELEAPELRHVQHA